MESPVVLDKPPEYCGKACNDRGFPFDEEEGSSAWSDLASRHPDIAARLRSRPSTWARKRRPSDQQSGDEFGSGGFENFDSFPFDNIPSEFRGHFPSHWNRRFGPRENSQQEQAPPQTHQQHTTSTQTEDNPAQAQSQPETVPPQQQQIPQYGLRNTVDLGQKSAAVDDDRSPRSMSAPPESRTQYNMNQQHEPAHEHQQQQHSNVRHIPIFVEGRDEPVINKSMDHGPTHGPAEPAYSSPPQAEREQYFGDEFHHPSNFPRSFGAPFNKGFRGSPQPFVQQKVYPQSAFARGASPQRSQSPRSHEEFVKIPVHHETHAEPHPPRPQQNKPQQQQPKQQQQQQQQQPKQQQQQQHQQVPPQQQQQPKQHQQQQHQQVPPQQQQVPPQQQQAPPQSQPAPQQEQKPQPPPKDPITQILSIQTDVLNLMNDVENFQGVKSDKKYLYLDEMLTRNLIKLDNIETEGKENIRQARKEAIKCIEKCIAVLEAKAEKGTAAARDVEMSVKQPENGAVENGETKEETKDNTTEAVQEETKPSDAPAPQVETAVAPQEPNTRPEGEVQTPNTEAKEKKSPKKGAKAKKNKEKAEQKTEEMNVDGDKVSDSQNMEVDGAAIPSQ